MDTGRLLMTGSIFSRFGYDLPFGDYGEYGDRADFFANAGAVPDDQAPVVMLRPGPRG